MKFAVSGVTQQGNLGGVAMLLTVRQELDRRHPGAEFLLLSISPGPDRAGSSVAGVTVVWAHWLALVALFLPLSLVVAPFHRVSVVRRALRRIGYFRALLDCDALVDLSGIAFVDGRGPALVAYNAACCMPAILLGRPVLKLAQSLGPFRTTLNRHVARWVLGRCALVIARGEASGRHLTALGGRPAIVCPDITFCLEVPPALDAWAAGELERAGVGPAPVLISPSRVLERDCRRHGIDLPAVCAGLVQALQDRGHAVALLAHSRAAGIAKNNDPAVCARIQALFLTDRCPPVLRVEDPLQARAMIGRASVFVGSRYHALVSAYAQAVPSVALSWNDKYADLARLFGGVDQVIPSSQVSSPLLAARVVALLENRAALSAGLRRALDGVRSAAAENFSLAGQAMEGARP